MKISIVTPAPPRSRKGNRITALRWARILGGLGHAVAVEQAYRGQSVDLMVALHARRSFAAIERFHHNFPDRPLIVALTGTDLYQDIHHSRLAQTSLDLASHLVLLQPHGITQLPEGVRPKARAIYQSVAKPNSPAKLLSSVFEVSVVGHLRPVKDPFRTAMAARALPPDSRIRVVQIGGALSDRMAQRAKKEAASNSRYRWLGELPRWKALKRLQRSRLLVLSSRLEGGANVVCEALALSVPILSSKISGTIGILGPEYPGYFDFRNTNELTSLMYRAETDGKFYRLLKMHGRRAAPLVKPQRERQSWLALLREVQ